MLHEVVLPVAVGVDVLGETPCEPLLERAVRAGGVRMGAQVVAHRQMASDVVDAVL